MIFVYTALLGSKLSELHMFTQGGHKERLHMRTLTWIAIFRFFLSLPFIFKYLSVAMLKNDKNYYFNPEKHNY